MKNTLKILALSFIMILGCSEDDISPKFSDVAWLAGGTDEDVMLQVNIDDYLTFLDISINPTSHVWEIQDGSFFLNEKFTTTDTEFAQFRVSGTSTEDKKANVVFTKAGETGVRLFNTFADSVTWRNSSGETLMAKLSGSNVWEFDTTLVVDVFDHIRSAFTIYKGDPDDGGIELLSVSDTDSPSLADSASWTSVTLERGEFLTYVDETVTGRPNTIRWRLNTGKSGIINNVNTTARIFYSDIGNYQAGILERGREEPFPEAFESKIIPLKIDVIQCTTPGVFSGNLIADESDVITFSASVPLLQFASGDEAPNFDIHVTNSNKSYDETFNPETITLLTSSTLELTLPAGMDLYRDDVVTLEYKGGNIATDCGTTLSAFGPESVTLPTPEGNLLSNDAWNTGFEVGKGDGTQPDGYFVQHFPAWSRDAAPSTGHGDFSLKHSFDGTFATPHRIQHNHNSEVFDTPGGVRYSVGAWVYVSSAGSDDAMIELGNNIKFELRPTSGPSPVFQQFTLSDYISTAKGNLDQWVFVKREQTIADNRSFAQFRIEFRGQGNTGKMNFFVDDLEVRILDNRP